MFTIPVISSSTRCVSESSGAMPLNALNGSCQMYNDEPLSSPGLPSYEEAVTSGSMFGLFNVNGGEDLNHRSQQQQTHSSCDHYSHPSLYQDLAPKVAISSDDFPPRYQTPRGSRDFENDERLDSSSELQCTRFSRITIASNSSLQSAVSSPEVEETCTCHHQTTKMRRKKRRHILCACVSLLTVIGIVTVVVLTTSVKLQNKANTNITTQGSPSNELSEGTNRMLRNDLFLVSENQRSVKYTSWHFLGTSANTEYLSVV